jgi:hypothetical protein
MVRLAQGAAARPRAFVCLDRPCRGRGLVTGHDVSSQSRRDAAGGSDAERLSKRLHDLSERIEAETAEHAPPRGPGPGDQGSRYGVAFRLASEFAVVVLGGAWAGCSTGLPKSHLSGSLFSCYSASAPGS